MYFPLCSSVKAQTVLFSDEESNTLAAIGVFTFFLEFQVVALLYGMQLLA